MDEAFRKVCEVDQEPADDVVVSILLVDDEPSNVKLLERTLEHCAYFDLVSTTDPRKVFDLCLQHSFDLIVLDLNMPYLDGFQVMSQLQELKNLECRPPILVVTAQHDQEHRVRALKEGAADYVTKPFQVDELLARVSNLIKARLYQKRMQMLNQRLEAGVRERTEELFRSRQMIRDLAAHREKIREEERARIAREIHVTVNSPAFFPPAFCPPTIATSQPTLWGASDVEGRNADKEVGAA